MENLYKKIYRLWEQTTDTEIVGYDADNNPIKIERVSNPEIPSIWTMGVQVLPTDKIRGREYTLWSLATDLGVGNAPQTYAEVFAGDYDIIRLFAEKIAEDLGIEE